VVSTVGHIDFDRTVHNVACLLVISSFSFLSATVVFSISHVATTFAIMLQSELQWVTQLMNSTAANMKLRDVGGCSEQSKDGKFSR